MNYAWRNPLTGMREQTRQSRSDDPAELAYLQSEARLRVWEELQGPLGAALDEAWSFHEQVTIGNVTAGGFHVDADVAQRFSPDSFAYCYPISGERIVSQNFPSDEIQEALARMSRPALIQEVRVYGQTKHFVVRRSDPRPELLPEPQEEITPQLGEPGAILERKRELDALLMPDMPDAAMVIAKTTAWALLDIAGSLRFMRGESPVAKLERELSGPQQFGIAEEVEQVCDCDGSGRRENGTWCVCELGRACLRAEVVAQRPQMPRGVEA